MKALTLYQPWATLIVIGAKQIETRSWKTDYRGPLAIHAGMEERFINMRHSDYVCGTEPFCSILTAHTKAIVAQYRHPLEQAKRILPRGYVVAICELVDCVKINSWQPSYGGYFYSDSSGHNNNYRQVEYPIPPDEPELSFGDYTAGRYAWILRGIKPLPDPVPTKGALGLWEWAP